MGRIRQYIQDLFNQSIAALEARDNKRAVIYANECAYVLSELSGKTISTKEVLAQAIIVVWERIRSRFPSPPTA